MTAKQVWDILTGIKDPEIPVVDIVELGIARKVEIEGEEVRITITPTYSGCPAMHAIRREIEESLRAQGFSEVKINTVFSPPWTTDWLSEETKERLRQYGIAPPPKVEQTGPWPFARREREITCPFCSSQQTEKRSEFGSTPCKAMYYCHGCQQPFEHFKCI